MRVPRGLNECPQATGVAIAGTLAGLAGAVVAAVPGHAVLGAALAVTGLPVAVAEWAVVRAGVRGAWAAVLALLAGLAAGVAIAAAIDAGAVAGLRHLGWAAHAAVRGVVAALAGLVLVAGAHAAQTVAAAGTMALGVVQTVAGGQDAGGATPRGPPDWRTDPLGAFEAAGCDVRGHGREVEVAPPGHTHHTWKVNTAKGVYLDTATGQGGTLASLMRRLGQGDTGPIDPAQAARRAAERDRRDHRSRTYAAEWLVPQALAADERAAAEAAMDAYLRGRGLGGFDLLRRAGLSPVLRTAQPRHAPSGAYCVAVAVTVPDTPDHPAVAVLALDPAGRKTTPPGWDAPRRTYGPRPPGAHQGLLPVRPDLLPLPGLPDGSRLVVAEGLETVLAAMLAVGGHGAYCVDAGHLRSLLDCPQVAQRIAGAGVHLVVAADREPSGAGASAAADCAARARTLGVPCLVLAPPDRYGPKADWADVLQRDGVAGAEAAAREAAQAAMPQAPQDDTLRRLPWIRPIAGFTAAPLPAPIDLAAERAWLRGVTTAHVVGEGPDLSLLAEPCGTGKSHAAAGAVRAAPRDAGSLYVVGTRADRDTIADLADAVAYPARSPLPDDPGYCARYADLVVPLAEQRRGIVPHACQDCALGLATMGTVHAYRDSGLPIHPRDPRDLASDHLCPYVWHTEAARGAAHAVATAAKLAGDDGITAWRVGRYRRMLRAVVADDVSALTDVVVASVGHVSQWARIALRQAAADEAAAAHPGTEDDARPHLMRRADLLHQAQPHLRRLGQWLATQAADDGQVRLDPAEWADLCAMVAAPGIQWVDATGAEAMFRASDGTREIPLRALQATCEAIAAGTCWAARGVLLGHVPSAVARLVLSGRTRVMITDATPPGQVVRVIQARGGTVVSHVVQPPNLRLILHPVGGHGKVACMPDSPSYARERDHLLATLRRHAEDLSYGASMAAVSHMAFVLRLLADQGVDLAATPPRQGYVLPLVPGRTIYVGWWGRHHIAHNEWMGCQLLVGWGVPIRSPEAAERDWVAEETVVARAGGRADPTWDGSRVTRWSRVPGAPYEIRADGYARDDIDAWDREWTTGHAVQLIGRLRGVARPDVPLTVHLYCAFPLADEYGLRVDAVDADVAWRSGGEYRTGLADDAMRRARLAAEALRAAGQRVSRRAMQAWLHEHRMPALSPEVYGRIRAELQGRFSLD